MNGFDHAEARRTGRTYTPPDPVRTWPVATVLAFSLAWIVWGWIVWVCTFGILF